MIDNCKISIVIPVYNVEKYLQECVDSVVKQSYKNIEIILVDDGSKDNSPKLCDELAKTDDRIKVIHKENGGVSSARNVGLANAEGEYIAFVDADDFVLADSFIRALKYMQQDIDKIIEALDASYNSLDAEVSQIAKAMGDVDVELVETRAAA